MAGMRRGRWLGLVVGALLVAACSGGGSKAAPTTTTTSSTTSTTAPTTTTTSPESAVKTAYLAYWAMVDRVLAAPDPGDPEIPQRTAEPLLTDLRAQISTKASQHHTFTVPPGNTNTHTVTAVVASGDTATLSDCFVDGRVELGPNGEAIDAATVTKLSTVTLTFVDGEWRVSKIQITSRTQGISPCGA